MTGFTGLALPPIVAERGLPGQTRGPQFPRPNSSSTPTHVYNMKTMGRNIEIKARCDNLETVAAKARELASAGPLHATQEDTFSRVFKGRLKLRISPPAKGEFIYYFRADTTGPAQSRYFRVAVPRAELVKRVCSAVLGVKGVVRKHRTIYLVGNTRVHLDEVEGLGSFVEIEVVLPDGGATGDGVATAEKLMEELSIGDADLVPSAYLDLLNESNRL